MEGRCGVTAELGAGVGAMEGAMQLGWPDAEFEFNELEDGYHAADREGWPVYIEKPGKVDRKKLMQITSADVHVVGLKNFSNTAKELVHHTQKRGND
uniref:Uncharacterized protein n=1 Tax=Oryza punctata TaxID=4537 RepID=A0A0E0K922_ORYPU